MVVKTVVMKKLAIGDRDRSQTFHSQEFIPAGRGGVFVPTRKLRLRSKGGLDTDKKKHLSDRSAHRDRNAVGHLNTAAIEVCVISCVGAMPDR